MQAEPDTLDPTRLRALPKAQVHIHLEGTFEPAPFERWAHDAGMKMPRPREELLHFEGLADFLDWACGLVSTAARFADLARASCERLRADGTGHADLIFNPTHWSAWHGRLRPVLDAFDAFDASFREAGQGGLPKVGLSVSLLRTQSVAQALELVDVRVDWRHPRLVALSVDGNEATAGRTGPRFAEAFRKAGAAGLRRTVHAGKSSAVPSLSWLERRVRSRHRDDFDPGPLCRRRHQAPPAARVAERVAPVDACKANGLDRRLDEHGEVAGARLKQQTTLAGNRRELCSARQNRRKPRTALELR